MMITKFIFSPMTAIILVSMTLPGPAAALFDTCQDLEISFENNRSEDVKVTKVEYYDYDANKWRNERTWLGIRINPGDSKSRKRDLEHVRADDTKIKFEWKYKLASGWSSIKTFEGPKFLCRNGGLVRFGIN